jgi:cytidine deaminase
MTQTADDLFQAALAVRARAYAPYSGFRVGAAVRGASGLIYAGCNAENAAYPEGWCAETAALAQLIAAGERQVAEVCLVTDRDPPATPCGGCRQRLAELAGPETPVHLADLGGIRRTMTLAELLPAAFTTEPKG